MSAEVQDLAVRYGAAWAAHDLDAIMALHTEDTVFHLHGDAPPAVGLAAVRDAFVCDGVDVFSVRDGLVARKDTYLDWAAVQRQAAELVETPASA